jgi:hypothetical protein
MRAGGTQQKIELYMGAVELFLAVVDIVTANGQRRFIKIPGHPAL